MAENPRRVDQGMPSPPPAYTIGHSTKSIREFVELLRAGRVQLVVDIRSITRSRTNPQYDRDTLPVALAAYQIAHEQIPELGGLRKKSKTVPSAVNGFWINQSFHNYADYALSDEFRTGLDRLLELASYSRCAIMWRKRSGGIATGGSLPTTLFRRAGTLSISWAPREPSRPQ